MANAPNVSSSPLVTSAEIRKASTEKRAVTPAELPPKGIKESADRSGSAVKLRATSQRSARTARNRRLAAAMWSISSPGVYE
eukprot:CAMPEP_0177552672 /NCGR_PEP_ID=MMETSP0369-20130122/66970_1 /TAXON_ID=447022 ORGANISM="Scrippsiella hangoei-like, Strain SHHI-4" /NCGR_SAMPLE_ID=MMETSP0369 /ASSEMBLY_ACC=CAM_ASM_000364 /LENGTH=81 /DNA_ID=CAMNT_0019038435 /DNA_START=101 /DNA_END=347 /DNA_ORIENTATION=-